MALIRTRSKDAVQCQCQLQVCITIVEVHCGCFVIFVVVTFLAIIHILIILSSVLTVLRPSGLQMVTNNSQQSQVGLT